MAKRIRPKKGDQPQPANPGADKAAAPQADGAVASAQTAAPAPDAAAAEASRRAADKLRQLTGPTGFQSGSPVGRTVRRYSYKELMSIMENETKLKVLLVQLGASDTKSVLVGRLNDDGMISGLKIITPEESNDLDYHLFHLTFEKSPTGLRLRSAGGVHGLELAVSYLKGMLGREISDPAERALVARWLGTPARAKKGEPALTVQDVINFLARGDFYQPLDAIHKALKGEPLPEKFVIAGVVMSDDKVVGISMIAQEEAYRLNLSHFCLTFEKTPEGLRINSAEGPAALELSISYLEGIIGREISDPAERALVARWLGTPARAKKGEPSLTVQDVINFLAMGDFYQRLDAIYETLKGKPLPKKIVITGRPIPKGIVVGLKAITPEEADPLDDHPFRFTFEDTVDGLRFVPEANPTAPTRRILDTIEAAPARVDTRITSASGVTEATGPTEVVGVGRRYGEPERDRKGRAKKNIEGREKEGRGFDPSKGGVK